MPCLARSRPKVSPIITQDKECLAEYFDYWIFALEREREEKKIKEEKLRQAGNREVRTCSIM